MRIQSLEAFGVHPSLLGVWEDNYGPELLPSQAAAVSEVGVLSGRSVVVYAPTGAGKTFIGEMAAMRAATEGQRVVYLTPTKALAEEKFSTWTRIYGSLGLRIVISTRDRRRDDTHLTRGAFDLAICVPEKLRFLLSQSPGTARRIGCVIVDELQLIGDPNRGLCLEVLLAQILRHALNIQIVGLSAVIDKPQSLGEWLGAEALCVHQRPVELRKGVLAEGIFRYREHNSGRIGEEEIGVDLGELEFADAVVELAGWFAQHHEPTLVFMRDKASAVRLAYRLAEVAGLPPAEQTRKRLSELSATSVRSQLTDLLSAGIAFHNADLQFEERHAVQAGFASGEIRLLTSTSTLAMGVNLPAKNVIIDPYRWEDSRNTGRVSLAPVSRADFENMGGRAGRLRFSDDFGRAILLADTEFMQAAMLDRYVHNSFEPVIPTLAQQPPLTQLLALCATGYQATEGDLAEVYQHTFAAHQQAASPDRGLPAALQQVAQEAVDCGLFHYNSINSTLTVTPQGRLCGASGLSLAGFKWLSHWVAASGGEVLCDLAALLVACTAPEAREVPFRLRFVQGNESDFAAQLCEVAAQRGEETRMIEEVLETANLNAYQRRRGSELARAMLYWASCRSTVEVEQTTQIPAGRLQLCAETVGWLLQIISQIGAQAGWPSVGCAHLSRWADAIAAGLPESGVDLYQAAYRRLDRDHVLTLLQAGVDSWEAMQALPEERRRELLPNVDLNESAISREFTLPSPSQPLPGSGGPASISKPQACEPILVMDEGRPDVVIFRGSEIYLRPAEYKLLHVLAIQPQRCVSYETIYNEIWGAGEIVEPAQVYWHRHQLAEKLKQAQGGDNHEQAVPLTTIPRRGYMLDLAPEQVLAR